MPSPTSSTLPTSDRSTLLRYCRISSVITEVISSTLNLMPAPRAYVACVTRASIQPVHRFFLVTTASRRPRSTNRARRCDSRGLLKASLGSPPHPLDPLPTLRGEGDAPSLPLARDVSLLPRRLQALEQPLAAVQLLRAALCQLRSHVVQPGRQAGVGLLSRHLHHEAAEDGRIDALDQLRLLAGQLGDRLGQAGALRLAQRHGGGHPHVDQARQIAGLVAGRGGDRRQQREAS